MLGLSISPEEYTRSSTCIHGKGFISGHSKAMRLLWFYLLVVVGVSRYRLHILCVQRILNSVKVAE